MKALTLWQPWASAIPYGFKGIETRSWGTNYRGPLAIHASKRKMDQAIWEELCHKLPELRNIETYPFGCIVATCKLIVCTKIIFRFKADRPDMVLGDFTPGRYAWILRAIKAVDPPIAAKGHQGLWEWEEAI